MYQTIRPIEVFQYENTRINFKFCAIAKKKKKQYFRLELSILGTQKVFFPDP